MTILLDTEKVRNNLLPLLANTSLVKTTDINELGPIINMAIQTEVYLQLGVQEANERFKSLVEQQKELNTVKAHAESAIAEATEKLRAEAEAPPKEQTASEPAPEPAPKPEVKAEPKPAPEPAPEAKADDEIVDPPPTKKRQRKSLMNGDKPTPKEPPLKLVKNPPKEEKKPAEVSAKKPAEEPPTLSKLAPHGWQPPEILMQEGKEELNDREWKVVAQNDMIHIAKQSWPSDFFRAAVVWYTEAISSRVERFTESELDDLRSAAETMKAAAQRVLQSETKANNK